MSFDAHEKVPEEYHYALSTHERALKNKLDSEGRPRCIALRGAIGSFVSCGIYEHRPSPCRAFRYSYENGGPREERCDQARAAIGLAPLQPIAGRASSNSIEAESGPDSRSLSSDGSNCTPS